MKRSDRTFTRAELRDSTVDQLVTVALMRGVEVRLSDSRTALIKRIMNAPKEA